ncbi:hypothetical protein PQ478_10805 [Alkalihalophilus pseudofirmus]|uniref:hypothetical protein n=1 Tax=Alkalihalophilus pseudofirmus TaxID=79885 RepID=UPI00259BA431|nr:hypothetical protein [Alkalihalophilus pseudofirmus]WEG18948.1 hypothetical protein PQ478_10805 [Alkalihalophilus pseudofirmus]
MSTVHDCKLLNYQVDFERSRLEINVLDEEEKNVKIIFEDLFTFHFEDQLPNSILLDIVEEDVHLFASKNKELLHRSKDYSWPMNYENIKELVRYIKQNNYTYYQVQASYGLNGWVLAKRLLIK